MQAHRDWLIKLSTSVGATVFAILIGFAIIWTTHGERLENYIGRTMDYRVRVALGKNPQLSPKLKIFAFDDRTIAGQKSLDVSLERWGKILKSFADRQPRAIMIDKMFYMRNEIDQVPKFVETVQSLSSPVVVGGFLSPRQIFNRKPLTEHGLATETAVERSLLEMRDEKGTSAVQFLYGADLNLLPAFHYVGHINHSGDNHIHSYSRIDQNRVLPHWTVFAAEKFKFVGANELRLDQYSIEIDETGRFPLNLLSIESIAKSAYSMLPVIARIEDGQPITFIQPGDVAIILPAMYTGNADFVETPLGRMPGGFILSSQVNALLTGQWLTKVPAPWLWITLAGVIGFAIGLFMQGLAFWVASLFWTTAIVCGGLAAFAFFSLITPWFPVSVTFALSSLAVFADRNRLLSLEKARLQGELNTASIVQQTFMPSKGIDSATIGIQGFYQSASECSGDFWNYVEISPGKYVIIVGDVVGHGTGAALITAMAYSAFRGFLQEHQQFSTASIAHRLNQVLCESSANNAMMTAFIVILDTVNGTLEYTNAGHTVGILVRRYSAVERLFSRNNPTGVIPDAVFTSKTLNLEAGDRLILYTDGLTAGHQRLGFRQLNALLANHRQLDLNGLVWELAKRGPERPNDDVTLVVVEYRQSLIKVA